MLVESVSGPKPYPLRTAADAAAVVQAVREDGHANVGFLCDLFHLANNGDDVVAAIAAYADITAHVQIADCPGRGEPGSGELDLDGLLGDLASARVRRLGGSRVQADHHHRGRARLAAPRTPWRANQPA